MRYPWLAAIRPAEAPWAVRPAVWAILAAAVIAGAGVITGDLVATGLAYFGVACSAVFVTWGAYRARVISLAAQAGGAVIGIILGVAVGDGVPAKLALAAAVALVSGMVGAVGLLSTAAALMAVIGVAFGEFARVDRPGREQGAWYLGGTLIFAVFALRAWPVERDHAAWDAVATVFDRAATLIDRVGQDDAPTARADLASASATSRTEVFDHRLRAQFGARGSAQRLRRASDAADQVALAAATFYADGRAPSDASVVDRLHQAANDCRNHRVPTVPPKLAAAVPITRPVRPVLDRARGALRLATARPALLAGLRLSLCMTVATAVTCALHTESHSFWLPLTVAVAVRPEYASVFVRTVNRVPARWAARCSLPPRSRSWDRAGLPLSPRLSRSASPPSPGRGSTGSASSASPARRY